MIPLGITFLAFFLCAVLTKSRTYALLAIFALLNWQMDAFQHETDRWLVLTYAMLDFMACVAILRWGDTHQVYQTVILALMVFCHYMMELALVMDYVWFIESDIYIQSITGLLLAQFIGGWHGIYRTYHPLHSAYSDFWEACGSNRFNRTSR